MAMTNANIVTNTVMKATGGLQVKIGYFSTKRQQKGSATIYECMDLSTYRTQKQINACTLTNINMNNYIETLETYTCTLMCVQQNLRMQIDLSICFVDNGLIDLSYKSTKQ